MSRTFRVLPLAALMVAATGVMTPAQTVDDLSRQVSDLAVQYEQSTDSAQRADLLNQLKTASVSLTQAMMPLDRNGNVIDNPGTRENAARYTLMTIGKSLDACDYATVSRDLVGSNADWYGLSLPPSFNLGRRLVNEADKASCGIPGLLALYGYPATGGNLQSVRQNSYQLNTLVHNGGWQYPGCMLSCINSTQNLWKFSYRKPEPPPERPAPPPPVVEPAPVRGLW